MLRGYLNLPLSSQRWHRGRIFNCNVNGSQVWLSVPRHVVYERFSTVAFTYVILNDPVTANCYKTWTIFYHKNGYYSESILKDICCQFYTLLLCRFNPLRSARNSKINNFAPFLQYFSLQLRSFWSQRDDIQSIVFLGKWPIKLWINLSNRISTVRVSEISAFNQTHNFFIFIILV